MASTAELSILITGKNEAGKAFNDAEKSVSGFSKALAGVGKIATGFLAADVLQGGLAKITDFASNSVAAFKESQQAAAQLNAVLKSTGGAAGVTADELTKYAGELEKASLFEDEAIIGAQSLLLTFTKIGKDIMPAATQTVLDMSQALGQDLQSSSVQLGKALNDPIAGISALSRVGVTFTEQQKEQIKAMVEAGNVAGAQKLILAELTTEFGGSAKAASDAAGASEVQKDKMNELNEVIGQKLLPITEKWKELQVAVITWLVDTGLPAFEQWIEDHKELAAAMESVASFIEATWPTIETVMSVALDQISTQITSMITVLNGIVEAVTFVVDQVKAAFSDAGTWLVQPGSDLIQGFWDGMKTKWEEAKRWLSQVKNDAAGALGNAAIGAVPGIGPAYNIGRNLLGRAAGDANWRGGPVWVGERGPELVNLPGGTRIHNNRDSMAMAGGQPIVINVHGSILTERDIMALFRDAVVAGGFRKVLA